MVITSSGVIVGIALSSQKKPAALLSHDGLSVVGSICQAATTITTGEMVDTADEVNAAQEHSWGDSMKHDAINRHILIRTRCERLGVPVTCLACEGSGRISVARDKTRLVLTLWVLHPRKGASRGVEISSIRKSELPAVIKFLKKAAERNAERFAKVNLT